MRKGLLGGLLLLLLFPVMASETGVLTLDRDTSLSLALENNSDLLDQALALETVRRSSDSSWNLYLPSIRASLGLSGSADISGSGSSTSSRLTPGLSVSYTVTPGLKESVEQLRLNLESSEISYQAVKLQLLQKVEAEFYYLLTAGSNLEIQKKNIELADRQVEQTQAKFANGLVSELAVLQARVNAANLVPAYSSLESAYQNRLKEFLVVLGVDPMTGVELSGSLETGSMDLDAETLIARYLENRTDIRTQRKQVEILESSLAQARKAGTLPSLSLSASFSDSVSDPLTAAGWQDYSPSVSASLSASLSLSLDSYIRGSSTDLSIRKIEDSLSRAELALDQLIQSARLEIINLTDSLATDRENLELSRLNLELSETSYRMTEESFDRGRSDRITLDDAQQDLLISRQNLLESRYEYMNDLITLRTALGLESLEGLTGGASGTDKGDKE